ncbi:TfoX/Sxy family protein [Nocardioides sp.]|uniref:TfoX/Sxy family protein n=1 Tax=Nocardioides sp. TaxID=35761 RepID=UPI0027180E18|nr:TfoX/Sxy family protein [Nocardioides sp.]MDO9455542.1 TfoX/Sxy family protein [Nocardioides sp.]
MAYDEQLAGRVREALAPEGPADERTMFGGLAFMVDGHMTVCVSGSGGLMVRVTDAERAGLLEHDHVEPMVMGGRTSRTWVRVSVDGVADDEALDRWVARGVAVVRTLPPKG